MTQGSRIAFARQFRRFTQDEVSEKLGLTGESKRVNITRYEKGERTPKEDRVIEIGVMSGNWLLCEMLIDTIYGNKTYKGIVEKIMKNA